MNNIEIEKVNMNIKDEWETPENIYDWLDDIYYFEIDLCSNKENGKALINVTDIFKLSSLGNKNAFINPPYSNIGPFIKKAWELSGPNNTVVCLVPQSIKTCKYLDFLEIETILGGFSRNWRHGVQWIDLKRRVKFTHPTLKSSSPSFGCCLLILNRPEYNNG